MVRRHGPIYHDALPRLANDPNLLKRLPQSTAAEPDSRERVARPAAVVLLFIAAVLSATAVWSAWDFGGGYRSTKFVSSLLVLVTVPIGCVACVMLGTNRCRPPAIAIIAGLVWIGGLCQCVDWNADFVEFASPGSLAVATDWLPAAMGEAGSTPVESATISVSPTDTRMALAIPATFAVACWLSSICFSSRRVGLVFLVTAAIAGGTFAFFGLADALRLARDSNVELRQRLIISPVGADGPFGPFVNNNNCAGYLILTLGCAFGLLTYLSRESARRFKDSSDTDRSAPSRSQRLFRHWRILACGLIIAVTVAGILGSGSRGGFVGLVAGATVMSLTAFRFLPRLRLAVGLLIVLSLAILTLDGLGIREQSQARLRTLYEGEALHDPRLAHWSDGLTAAIDHMPAGAGFGAYRYAYLPYQEQGGGRWFLHADGMPVEWLLEGGVWLLPLVILGVVLIGRDLRRLAAVQRSPNPRQGDDCMSRAMLTAGTFIVPGMLASQCFDFGVLQPPLFLTLAFVCGGVAHSAAVTRRVGSVELSTPKTGRYRLAACGLICLAGLLTVGLSLGTSELYSGTIVQNGERMRWKHRNASLADVPHLDAAIETAEDLVLRHPENAFAQRLLAQLIIDRQRQLGEQDLISQGISASKSGNWVSPMNLRRAFYGDATHSPQPITELMLPSQDLEQWRVAREHATAALRHCPLDDATRVLLVELDMVDSNANAATPDLLKQTAVIRRRNRSILRHLEGLARVYPGASTARQIRGLNSDLSLESKPKPAKNQHAQFNP